MRLLLALLTVAFATAASAHPHVWVAAKSELVFGPDGRLAAIRHHWTFDEAYSAYATEGLDANGDGQVTPDELAGLAKTSTESLDEFDYFTRLKSNGSKQAFGKPQAERMTFSGGRLTLHFDLPLLNPAVGRTMVLDVYDPTFFVDFETSPEADAVLLNGAPGGCTLRITRPKPAAAPGETLPESFFQTLSANSAFGAQYASRAMAVCP